MCYFQTVQFELYPERTRLHEDYYIAGETEAEHEERIIRKKCDQDELNRAQNHCGQVVILPHVTHLTFERKQEYQPQMRYSVYTNPEPTDESGDEHKKYWVVDTMCTKYFVEPGVIVRGFDQEEDAQRFRHYYNRQQPAKEHKMKDLATIEWSPAVNPNRFTAKLLRAGDQQPMDLGTFRGEQAVDEAEAAIRAQSSDPVFVLPGRFAENVACLSPKDDRIYFDRYGN